MGILDPWIFILFYNSIVNNSINKTSDYSKEDILEIKDILNNQEIENIESTVVITTSLNAVNSLNKPSIIDFMVIT